MSARLLAALVLFAALAFPAKGDPGDDGDHFFTRDLPEPDGADVIFVESPDPSHAPKISLGTKDARALAALIRAQSWGPSARPCGNQQYIFHFYANEKLLAAESICFHCRCLASIASDVHAPTDKEAFDVETPEAAALRNFLKNLFPPTP